MSTAAITQCARSECDDPPLDGLDLCSRHHQEIVLGLDECKARECDKRVPFGSLWCPQHKAMREAGNLSASGERLDEIDESVPCRLCGKPSLKRTVGKRPQGGWNELCQGHYDEKRATHGRSLAVARAAIPREETVRAPVRSVSIPDHLKPKMLDTSPDAEVRRRSEYLLEHDWATGFSTLHQADRWFLPVNVTQPAGGRTLDEAYAWQVALESGRAQHELTSGEEPDRQAHADGCLLDSDHEGECETTDDRIRRRLEEPPRELTALDGQPVPADAVIHEAVLTPTMDWQTFAAHALSPRERVVDAWADALAAVYVQIVDELGAGDHERVPVLIAHAGALLAQARDEIAPALAAIPSDP